MRSIMRRMGSLLATDNPVPISRGDFERMLRFARIVSRLEDDESWHALLADRLPGIAAHRPGWPGILMGYDFHLGEAGPKLIEINNNAGGLYVGGEAGWIPQPDLPELEGELPARLLSMFPPAWRTLAIMDEQVRSQFMYPEMKAYAALLRGDGRRLFLADPEEIAEGGEGRLHAEGAPLDAIYNRHTDFYLESPALAHVRRAYLADKVALNPHPRSYALIGDKARMADFHRPGLLEACLDAEEVALVRAIVPETRRMAEMDAESLWRERKRWVFKPAARHGGKGVLPGKGMTRKRFESLDPAETIVQEWSPPSEVEVNGARMKLDIRLFMHGRRLIALAGRIWRGQITNFRAPGSGWVPLAPGGD